MAFQIPETVEALFGGRTRAAILGYLAELTTAQTGYAIAKDLGIGVSKVYPELRRLEAGGVLGSRPSAKGAKRFFLKDEDLRRFLVKRVRIVASEDWFSPERLAMRRADFETAKALELKAPEATSASGRRQFAKEFPRPAAKDRALRRMRRAAGGAR